MKSGSPVEEDREGPNATSMRPDSRDNDPPLQFLGGTPSPHICQRVCVSVSAVHPLQEAGLTCGYRTVHYERSAPAGVVRTGGCEGRVADEPACDGCVVRGVTIASEER
ncbi:hypothetical protein BD311DRAFT_770538 [Dichomitus squalens]|uniref:Uncharacterized protein n=1 Tax=Dichomitus squalens TaxID=114155 RepID=A0A4Q9M5X1_9APHY|nr:hypothetical protein BD311DRAFT_770538 [Dichomitus squalens]